MSEPETTTTEPETPAAVETPEAPGPVDMPEVPSPPAAAPPPVAGTFAARGPAPTEPPASADPGGPAGPAHPGPATDAGPAARPRRWRSVLVPALVGALVGAGVAGGIVAAVDDDGSTVVRTVEPNTSRIEVARDIQSILAQVEPAVVSVRTRSLDVNAFLEPVPSEGAGTGVVIGAGGVIVTNNHVVEGAQQIQVVLATGDTLSAVVLGRDPELDIAVLKVDRSGLPVADLGDSADLQVGDDVIAIGNALALPGGPTVTRGIISALDRTIANSGVRLENMIQIDAAINPGNSGGPLVNSRGEVVGINRAIIADAQNIGFAIAIDAVKPAIADLREGRVVTRPFLGVNTLTVNERTAQQFGIDVETGAYVLEVTPGSSAELAGIQRGDVIVRIGNTRVDDADDVASAIRDREPGEEVTIAIVRGGDRRNVRAVLGRRASGS
jgi:S1-C subfamily serine protease